MIYNTFFEAGTALNAVLLPVYPEVLDTPLVCPDVGFHTFLAPSYAPKTDFLKKPPSPPWLLKSSPYMLEKK